MLSENGLFRLLMSLKSHPELRLGRKSLLALEALVNGYLDACLDLNQGDDTLAWFQKFDSYVVRQCGLEKTTCNAYSAILSSGYHDETGLDRFLELLERFATECNEPPQPREPSSALQTGEYRAIRLDIQKATHFVGRYLTEHCGEFFGVRQVGCSDTLVMFWDEEKNLSCVLANDAVNVGDLCAKHSAEADKIRCLPIFSNGDRVYYTSLSSKTGE